MCFKEIKSLARKAYDKLNFSKNKFLYLAIFFFSLQIIGIVRNISDGFPYFFWFCDFAPGLFAVLFFLKKTQFIKAAVNFGFFPQTIFFMSVLMQVFLKAPLAEPVLDIASKSALYVFSGLLIHSSSFIALVATYKTKPNIKEIQYSMLLVMGIYIVTLIFTSPSYHANFVYSTKYLIGFSVQNHTLLWPFFVLFLVVVPTHFIQKVLYYVHEKETSKQRKKKRN